MARFDPRLAYRLARVAALAYEPDGEALRAGLADLGFSLRGEYEIGSTRAIMVKGTVDDRLGLVLAFRGTRRNFADILTDIEGWPYRPACLDGEIVDRGFWFALASIYPDILADLRAEPAGFDLTVTGHSLGGALATLFAARALHEPVPVGVERLVTFGSPRCVGAFLARTLDGCIPVSWRIVHRTDVVPVVPRPWMRFRHLDALAWIGPALIVHERPARWLYHGLRAFDWLWRIRNWPEFLDHRIIDGYARALSRAVVYGGKR